MHLEHVAAHPEVPPVELEVISGVLDLDQVPQNIVEIVEATPLQKDHLRAVLLGTTETVDGGDASDHDDVPSGEQRARRRVPEAIDVLVDLGVLLDKGVRARYVSLGLVVVVVADEVLDGVVGKELGELAGELGRERLVVREDERGTAGLLYDASHGMGLPGSRNAEQGLRLHARVKARCELLYGLRLVAGRLVFAVYLEAIPSLDLGSSRKVPCRSARPRAPCSRNDGSLCRVCPSRCRSLRRRPRRQRIPHLNYTPRARVSHHLYTVHRGSRETRFPISSSPSGRGSHP